MHDSQSNMASQRSRLPVDASAHIAGRGAVVGSVHPSVAAAQIHPTAFVEPGAVIEDGVVIGPYSYVGSDVRIGSGTRLVSHASVLGRTTLGSGNTIWPQATIGADPQDLKYHGEQSELVIGDNNEFRESVTVHLGTDNGGGVTQVGNDNLLMVGAHVAHDCQIGDHVILGNAVQLAGHVHVNDHAVLCGSCGIHHYVTVGQYAFIGGLTRVVNDVPPFLIVEGNPSKVRGINIVGLNRHRFDEQTIAGLKEAYRRLYRGGGSGAPISMAENLKLLEAEHPGNECVRLLIQSIRDASIGLFGRSRETKRTDNRHQNPVK